MLALQEASSPIVKKPVGSRWPGGYFCRVGRVYATLKPALSRLRCDTLPGVASTEAVVQPAEAAAFRRMATRPFWMPRPRNGNLVLEEKRAARWSCRIMAPPPAGCPPTVAR